VLLLARDGEELIGYALTHVLALDDTWIPDTWRTGRRIAELESLAVVEGRRGEGIGSTLLEAVERELAAQGLDDLIVGVLPGNVDAIRVYERRGFRPTWMYLSRFAGR
jgi:ribosomal protein S18 acetylase RimI-like enzyme